MIYGFDIGGTKIAFSVYDQKLNCLYTTSIATPQDHDVFLTCICDLVLQADIKFSCLGKVGVGFPGAINPDDNTVYCVNVAAIKGYPLIEELSQRLQREIKFENDANCFLLSECLGGSAEGCATVLGITLGTGLGGAIFVNGGILSGQNCFAGEIGHYPLPATVLQAYPELPILTCACGRKMCLDNYVSGTGLANLYQHYENTRLTCPEILQKFHAGDKNAHKVVNIYFDILAAGIGTALLILDADAIVFGGGLSKFDILIDEISKRLPQHLLKQAKLPLLFHAKFGSEGGVRGAALLNWVK
ncbi:MAG: ROK family protein [Psychromonas sp.]